MEATGKKMGVVQNVGLSDRIIRTVLGAFLLGGAAMHLVMGGAVASWHAYAGLVSIYPFLTAMLGWDPFYSLFHTRTCSDTGRNQCGTLPYEVDAALGHEPKPDEDYDHSLTGSHH